MFSGFQSFWQISINVPSYLYKWPPFSCPIQYSLSQFPFSFIDWYVCTGASHFPFSDQFSVLVNRWPIVWRSCLAIYKLLKWAIIEHLSCHYESGALPTGTLLMIFSVIGHKLCPIDKGRSHGKNSAWNGFHKSPCYVVWFPELMTHFNQCSSLSVQMSSLFLPNSIFPVSVSLVCYWFIHLHWSPQFPLFR